MISGMLHYIFSLGPFYKELYRADRKSGMTKDFGGAFHFYHLMENTSWFRRMGIWVYMKLYDQDNIYIFKAHSDLKSLRKEFGL